MKIPTATIRIVASECARTAIRLSVMAGYTALLLALCTLSWIAGRDHAKARLYDEWNTASTIIRPPPLSPVLKQARGN